MTQALALSGLLRRAGHRVGGVMMGRNPRREVPPFFLNKIGAPVTFVDSPGFVTDAAQRSVRMGPTIWKNAQIIGRFRKSLDVMGAAFARHRPDVVVNFHEAMAGVYYRLRRPAAPMVCVAHQYMFDHPAYTFPPGRWVSRHVTKLFSRTTAWGATKRLALSLYPAPDLPEKDLLVMPPLLRREVFEQPLGLEEPFVLIYLLNRGYAREVIRWHEAHPEVRLHCFWDHPRAAPTYRHDATLTFHALDDEKFLAMMARCRGLVCTAGFESVSEAMYLGKPVLMVPVDGHFEQHCNALDGLRAGAGTMSTQFDIHELMALLPAYRRPAKRFRRWLRGAEARFVRAIEEAAGYAPAPLALAPPKVSAAA